MAPPVAGDLGSRAGRQECSAVGELDSAVSLQGLFPVIAGVSSAGPELLTVS